MLVKLKKQTGKIETGELFFIKEFNDGQVYLRDSFGRTTAVELDTLKAAALESSELATVFTDELFDLISK